MKKMQMKLTRKQRSMMPAVLIEAKMSDLTPNRLDVIHMLLAEIGKDTDIDDNLDYVLTAETYAKMKNYTLNGKLNVNKAYEILKNKIWGDPKKKDDGILSVHYELESPSGGWGHKVNLFQSVGYVDGKGELEMKLSQEFKEMLVEVKRQKGQRIFAALQFIIPMQSVYSKRLYMMCKEFENSGIRFTEKCDFKLFREKMGVPDSYRDNHIIDRVLEQAKREINQLSDIEVDYELSYKSGKGRAGKIITGVIFRIVKKDKNQLPGQISIEDFPEFLPESYKSGHDDQKELKEQLKKLIPKLTPQDISVILDDAKKKNLSNSDVIDVVTYVSGKNADNAVGYIRRIMEFGISDPIKTVAKHGFNDFKQHDYDFEELERIVLEQQHNKLRKTEDKL
ncbi:MAG: replication initiation protein [Butyrivibrio sp.]|nr:replication initiation protein [Butyrivibrio sp.]